MIVPLEPKRRAARLIPLLAQRTSSEGSRGTRAGPGHPLHSRRRGDTRQPGYQDVLTAVVWGGKSQEGGPHRLYAETADHTQRNAQTSDALADGTASTRLTVKTVADPISFPHHMTYPEPLTLSPKHVDRLAYGI